MKHAGLGSACIMFLTRRKVKIEPSVQKSIWCLGVQLRLSLGLKMSPRNGLRILNKDFPRFLSSHPRQSFLCP